MNTGHEAKKERPGQSQGESGRATGYSHNPWGLEIPVIPCNYPQAFRFGDGIAVVFGAAAFQVTPESAADLMLQLADELGAMCATSVNRPSEPYQAATPLSGLTGGSSPAMTRS